MRVRSLPSFSSPLGLLALRVFAIVMIFVVRNVVWLSWWSQWRERPKDSYIQKEAAVFRRGISKKFSKQNFRHLRSWTWPSLEISGEVQVRWNHCDKEITDHCPVRVHATQYFVVSGSSRQFLVWMSLSKQRELWDKTKDVEVWAMELTVTSKTYLETCIERHSNHMGRGEGKQPLGKGSYQFEWGNTLVLGVQKDDACSTWIELQEWK